jgi:prepilin-type N-terminal cleavage/methylation domain-containing protein
MRRSAPSTERRRHGFTLIEVVVAATILSTVLTITLLHLSETMGASTVTTVQADLRRNGLEILARMAEDVRATQAPLVSFLPDTIELTRLAAFDPASGAPQIERDLLGQQLFVSYACPLGAVTPDGRYGILRFKKTTGALLGSAPPIELSRELDLPPNGLIVTAVHDTGSGPLVLGPTDLLSLNPANHLLDQPAVLRITLNLRRRIAVTETGDQFVKATLATEVEVKPDGAY